MKTTIILIGILFILVCGCIELNKETGIEEIDKIENKNLSGSNISEIPDESEYSSQLKNETDETKIEAIKEPEVINESEVINEQELTNKSKINNFSNKSAIENVTNNNSFNTSNFTPKPVQNPEIKRIKFTIYGLHWNRDAQELESKLDHHVEGIIYARTSFADEDGEVVYDASEITRDKVVNEASFIATPGGIIALNFRITVTEEINCTQKNNRYHCCTDSECSIYEK